MRIFKKIVIIFSIACIAIAGAIAISFIFGVEPTTMLGKICFTLLTVSIAGMASLNAISLMEKKFNFFASLSVLLIFCCAGSILYIFWTNHWKWDMFVKSVVFASVVSMTFNFIVTSAIRLGKTKVVIQIITYSIIAIFDAFIASLIFYILLFNQPLIPQVFVIDCILAVVFSIITSVLSRSARNVQVVVAEPTEEVSTAAPALDEDTMVIRKEEYNELKARIKELEDKLDKYRTTPAMGPMVAPIMMDASAPMMQQPTPAAPQSEPNSWLCECGTKNTAKFCMNCGSPKPLIWVCECGTENNTKFCKNCGSPKPEVWLCECGTENNAKFCSNCGRPKDKPLEEPAMPEPQEEIQIEEPILDENE